jgi:hypothetical protein
VVALLQQEGRRQSSPSSSPSFAAAVCSPTPNGLRAFAAANAAAKARGGATAINSPFVDAIAASGDDDDDGDGNAESWADFAGRMQAAVASCRATYDHVVAACADLQVFFGVARKDKQGAAADSVVRARASWACVGAGACEPARAA